MRHQGSMFRQFKGCTGRAVQMVMVVAVSASVADARTFYMRYEYAPHGYPPHEYSRRDYGRAERAFDGRWSVLIQTESGPCDPSFRYGVDIVNGAVTYQGNPYGEVAPNGSVRVRLSLGGQHAEGVGRLSRSSGAGVWQGVGQSGVCTGRWFAERRGATTGFGR